MIARIPPHHHKLQDPDNAEHGVISQDCVWGWGILWELSTGLREILQRLEKMSIDACPQKFFHK